MDDYDSLVHSWTRTLRLKAPKTVLAYTDAARAFGEWTETDDGPEVPEPVDRPRNVAGIQSRHIDGWLNAMQAHGYKPSTINNRYRGLQQLLNWLVQEEELAAHPMARMKPPAVPAKRVDTVDASDLRKVLATCKKRDFTNSRDAAILLMYIDSGARLSEVASLTVDSVDLKSDAAYSTGKGNKPRVHSFGQNTAMALERYLRLRRAHKYERLPNLWLGHNNHGPMTSRGIDQMIRRRCALAGVPVFHAHKLRHTMATAFLDEGGSEGDLMRLMGWESRQMIKRYTDTTADKRAVKAHKRHSLGDRL